MSPSNHFISKKDVFVLGYVNIFRVLFVLLPICDSLCVADRIEEPLSRVQQHVHKRQGFDDYRMCAANFEIHQDKIIRTEESKRLGAKYLNGRDVLSKDECVKFCCATANCDVFVLEEKVLNQQLGTCYLFECGTPENFKCKFTRHLNYSSAVLIINRPQLQLEDEIQYSQHERELTSLRANELESNKSKNCHHKNAHSNVGNDDSIPAMRDTKDAVKVLDEDADDNTFKKSGKCSRFQFECRTSGECIAIYNACDGIPQCADKSDEDVELGCPTSGPPIGVKRAEDVKPNAGNIETAFKQTAASAPLNNVADQNFLFQQQQKQRQQLMMQQQQQQQQQQLLSQQQQQMLSQQQSMYNQQMNANLWQSKTNQLPYDGSPIIPSINDNYPNLNANSRGQSQDAIVSTSSRIVYPDRSEGEMSNGPVFPLSNTWSNKNDEDHILKQNYEPLHNFNPKQSDTINAPNREREYGNPPPFIPYRGGVYPPGFVGELPHIAKNSVWHQEYNNITSNPNLKNADYAYNVREDLRNRTDDLMKTTNFSSKQHEDGGMSVDKKILYVSNGEISGNKTTSSISTLNAQSENTNQTTPTDLKQSAPQQSTATTIVATTVAKKEDDNSPRVVDTDGLISHRKMESQLSADAQFLDANRIRDGYTEQPSGAFVSLTLGICVTAIMVFVVGCRLRVVRKRIRRGGKLPYAHDADFLVNGMYL